MNIQKKTSVLLIVVVFFYASLIILLNNNLWNKALQSLDNEAAINNNQILQKALNKELTNLAFNLKDYARWDDTYNFVKKKNKDFIEDSFYGVDPNIFSFFAIYNNEGKKLASYEVSEDGTLVPWVFLSDKIALDSLWYNTTIDKIRTGFLKIKDETFMFASSPILMTNTSENPNGILIFAKKFDETLKNRLKDETQINHTIIDITTSDFVKNDPLIINKIKKSNNLYMDNLGVNNSHTYSLIYDFFNRPIFIITIESPKKFETIGKGIQHNTVLFTILLALIILLIFYESIKIMIINPLKILQRIFQHISIKNEIPQGYYKKLMGNRDEISELTNEFRLMNDKIFDLNHNLESTVKERTLELRRANENLTLMEKIIENTAEGILVTDLNGNIIKVNRGFLSMSEFSEEEVLGKKPNILKSGKHSVEFYKSMWEDIQISGCWSGEVWNRRKDGAIFPKWLTINTIRDKDGNPLYYIGLLTDITKLKDVETKLNHLAYYDSLTGLPNRTLFYERLLQSIKFNKRYKSNLAVFFIDLDRFKNINDTLGHSYGDELLIEVSERLKERVRESDTVCRVGGDEFLVILDKFSNIDDVAMVANDIIKVIEKPKQLANKEIICSASLGISIFPSDDETADGLIRKADSAMYLAKDSGKGVYKFFSQDMEDINNAKLDLEIKLRKALEENRFELFYQPQINIEKYVKGEFAIIGCEALIRWRKEDGSLIPPDSFIPLAEETGMIIPIGKWVLEESCRTAAKWYREGTPVRVSANVSSIQFEDPQFLSYLDEALKNSNLPPHLLHLELTESMLLNNLQNTIDLLNAIKEKGILFSIDDFGTGYSSLSYIKELPASNLKIDKAFVFKMDNSKEDKALVQVIISIAKTFGMNSLAEGVETENHLNKLHEMGCEEIQGYLISKPLPQSEFEKFLVKNPNYTLKDTEEKEREKEEEKPEEISQSENKEPSEESLITKF